jgi:hypothetical protein
MLQKNNFNQLVEKINDIHITMQCGAASTVNQYLTIRNWLFGYHIVEFEQNGADRAKYGEKLIDELSKSLKKKGIKGIAPAPLRICRNFYIIYPQIWRTVSAKLQNIGFEDNILPLPIQPTVSVELQNNENQTDTIQPTVSVKLQNAKTPQDILYTAINYKNKSL